MTARRWSVRTETFGTHDDGPDVVVVRVDGEEVGAYCIEGDPERELAAMREMLARVVKAETEVLCDVMDGAATLTHDPDGESGCVGCPLVWTSALTGQSFCAALANRWLERGIAPPECPLRRGDVVVRRPR